MESAACRGAETEIFYAEAGPAVSRAKLVCAACSDRAECAQWGLAKEEFGIWGGLTARERARERRIRGIRLQ
jgi:WhiB family transcriptional regulator, redox-sensing transcriptional regulator